MGRFNRNYLDWTGYVDDKTSTKSKIADPMPFELIERLVNRMFSRAPKFNVVGKGLKLEPSITECLKARADAAWKNKDMISSTGTMRSKIMKSVREYGITGNTAAEVFYNNEIDDVDLRVLPIESVIFNPAMTLQTSREYFVLKTATIDELLDDPNYDAKKLRLLKAKQQDKGTIRSAEQVDITRSGRSDIRSQEKPIKIVEYWRGKELTVMADWEYVIRQDTDPLQIGDHPLVFAMYLEIVDQPYAFSILDPISRSAQAKSLILNQVIDWGAKALNPPLFVDPSNPNIKPQTLANAYKLGGIVMAAPQSAQHQPMPAIPPVGFDILNYIQQRAESATGMNAYLAGAPNSVSDKTQGTASGVKSLIEQSQPALVVAQTLYEESFIEPLVNKWMKLAGAMMGKNEIKDVISTGIKPTWLKVTKGLLTGHISLDDLLKVSILKPGEVPAALQIIQQSNPKFDPRKDMVIDADWLWSIETGSMAESDKASELQNFTNAVQFAQGLGVPLNNQEVVMEFWNRVGIADPETYFNTNAQPNGQDALKQKVTESLNYKDAPEDIKRQIESQAGMQPSQQLSPAGMQAEQSAQAAQPQDQGPTLPTPGFQDLTPTEQSQVVAAHGLLPDHSTRQSLADLTILKDHMGTPMDRMSAEAKSQPKPAAKPASKAKK